MNRTQKDQFISSFEENVNGANFMALMAFEKLTVEKMTNFRMALRKKGVRVRVVKNTLAKRVFDKSPYSQVSEYLTGPTLVAYGSEDVVEQAKAVYEWVNDDSMNIEVKAGVALGGVMDAQQMEALSKLPGRDELLVSFLWALKSAPTSFLYALQDAPRKLGYALVALKDKKEQSQ